MHSSRNSNTNLRMNHYSQTNICIMLISPLYMQHDKCLYLASSSISGVLLAVVRTVFITWPCRLLWRDMHPALDRTKHLSIHPSIHLDRVVCFLSCPSPNPTTQRRRRAAGEVDERSRPCIEHVLRSSSPRARPSSPAPIWWLRRKERSERDRRQWEWCFWPASLDSVDPRCHQFAAEMAPLVALISRPIVKWNSGDRANSEEVCMIFSPATNNKNRRLLPKFATNVLIGFLK